MGLKITIILLVLFAPTEILTKFSGDITAIDVTRMTITLKNGNQKQTFIFPAEFKWLVKSVEMTSQKRRSEMWTTIVTEKDGKTVKTITLENKDPNNRWNFKL